MMRSIARKGRRVFAPEVVQTSAMDCGPAALKCLLEGFDLPVSYARLLEACQTDLDGTSIDTIQQVAVALGLEAEQIMLPADHLLLGAAAALPALVVVRRDNQTHFLVAWQRHGPLVQLMDPARGRRWLREDAFRAELYMHEHAVPASGWREWAGSPEFLESLRQRLAALRVPEPVAMRVVRTAADDSGWRPLATLDAAIRMIAELVRANGLRAGRDAARVLDTLLERAAQGADPRMLVPASYWSVRPDDGQPDSENLIFRGAVLLRILHKRPHAQVGDASAGQARTDLQETLAPAVSEAGRAADSPPPLTQMWRLLREHGRWTPFVIGGASILAAGGALFEMLLLRGLLEMGQVLTLREHRLVGAALLIAFVAGMLLLDLAISGAVLRMGRRIEARLRAALLEKLPQLGERFLHSRLVSDMAHRAHSLDALRALPELGARFVRTSTQLVFTAIGLAWLDPPSAWLAALTAGLSLLIPLATTQMLGERELRQRNHAAALSRYYLEGLLGLVAARTHGAERALRQRHESLLVEWGRASLHLLRGAVVIEGVQMLVGSGLAALLVLDFVGRGGRPGSTLLLVYWALNLPMLGREVAAIVRQYPVHRNILARVLEPLQAPSAPMRADEPSPVRAADDETPRGVRLELDAVDLSMGGHTILTDVTLAVQAGEHVAIVGRSGAGKSSLVGLLLGWRTPTAGGMAVDGHPLDDARIADLRRRTAWVDPAIQLWNRSLFDNLRYGDPEASMSSIGSVVTTADLTDVLEQCPDGLQTTLGEAGGLLSGGEQQRVRFGRALVRQDVRLALLDEPFRGLDRQRRHDLLARARDIWREATLLCVTHDIEDTLSFPRVLVLEQGRLIEDGAPGVLARTPGSAYAALLAAERAAQTELWADSVWRRWRLEHGAVVEDISRTEVSWTVHQGSRGR